MKLSLDSRRFPRVSVAGLRVSLLPVLKAEFEYRLGEPNGPGLAWYQGVLAAAPRQSWRGLTTANVPGAILTGVGAAEAADVAAWAGPGARLPTADEWRAFDRALDLPADPREVARLAGHAKMHPAARAVVRAVAPTVRTWRDVALLNAGVLEWVEHPAGPGLFGRPPAGLFPLLLDPQANDPARPRTGDRHPAFGFRVLYPAGGAP